jgi:serine/threonine protein phosphatase PrpC
MLLTLILFFIKILSWGHMTVANASGIGSLPQYREVNTRKASLRAFSKIAEQQSRPSDYTEEKAIQNAVKAPLQYQKSSVEKKGVRAKKAQPKKGKKAARAKRDQAVKRSTQPALKSTPKKKPQPVQSRKVETFVLPEAPSCSSWKPRALQVDVTFKKMLKNRNKALIEHGQKEKAERSWAGEFSPAYATVEEAPLTFKDIKEATAKRPLIYSYLQAEAQGIRKTMEDAHFFIEIPQGHFTGVLDGHGGKAVAEFASKKLQEGFSKALRDAHGNVHQAFEAIIDDIHQQVLQNPGWNSIGSTAVLCFIDKATNLIYTATLGDSEANIYRTINGKLKSIPLSCVRDWMSKKDETRAVRALHVPERIDYFLAQTSPKYRRYPMPYGINVSRAIGDKHATGTQENPAVIHKPKITVDQLQPGDLLILACDGLKDYVPEQQIVQQISDYTSVPNNNQNPASADFFQSIFQYVAALFQKQEAPADLAHRLVKFALDVRGSEDNVTTLAIQVS